MTTWWLVIGHLTPTDATPDPATQGRLDDGVTVEIVHTRQLAENWLLWYQDGLIREIKVA